MAVGRIVHYRSHGTPYRGDGSQAFPPACRAAIVTEYASDNLVGLKVADPIGDHQHPLALGGSVRDDAGVVGGSWHWVTRCPFTAEQGQNATGGPSRG